MREIAENPKTAGPKLPKRDVHGWIALDKPYGMTSTQAVGAIKRIFRAKKAGHAGTLDPLATGILPVALGEATKTVPFAVDGEKVYRFTVEWGKETRTDDAEGEVSGSSVRRPLADDIQAILPRFRGIIEQVPPAFSAINVNGARAYDLAREGETVELKARPVQIDELTLLEVPDPDHAVFEAVCGKGTYVRALARDMGRVLGCCGHVSALRRLAVGPFDEHTAISLEELGELRHKGGAEAELASALLPVETALDDIPAFAVNRQEAARLRRGQDVLLRGQNAPLTDGPLCAMQEGLPVAIGEIQKGSFHPKRVFNFSA